MQAECTGLASSLWCRGSSPFPSCDKVLRWDVIARSRFTALASLIRAPACLLPKPLVRSLRRMRTAHPNAVHH